jgi:TPR repeat protein
MNLIAYHPNPQTPWNFSEPLFERVQNYTSDKSFKLCEVLPADPDLQFILKYFEQQKPAGYGIKRVVCIHNHEHTLMFESTLKNMEREASNPIFIPKGKAEEPQAERARVVARWESQAAQFSPVEIKSLSSRGTDTCSKVKVFPLWHGSTKAVCQSICWSGFTSFGKHHYFDENATKGGTKSTDKGYFGSGIYFTNSARYATMYSSGGHLLLAWVSMREPYPVVNDKPHPQKGSDMLKLEGRMHYQNYNAHFIPVASIRPQDPKCLEYYPCFKDQQPAWDEFVVFYPAQALPRFWVELGTDFPKVMPSDLGTTGEFLSLLLNLLSKLEIQQHPELVQKLQAKADLLLGQAETTSLGIEDQRFFKLAKRLLLEGEKLNTATVNMLIRSGSTPPRSPLVAAPFKAPIPPAIALKTSALSLSSTPLAPVTPQSIVKTPFPSIQPPPFSISWEEEEEYKKALNFRKRGDFSQAFVSYLIAAEKGHQDAMFLLSRCYRSGEGVTKDLIKAESWCRKAADRGHLVAMGACYYFGYGVAQDFKEAAKWYRKAAEQGNAIAQFNLGVCYSNGKGVPKDEKEAVKWFQRAAEQGDTIAECNLGLCYKNGLGVVKDEKEAVKWFQKAAEQGHAGAQFNLGVCYKNGQGVPKEEKKAVKWFRKAAEQGDAYAQNSLGNYYYNVEGTALDYQEAVKWYRKAAEQGHATAQFNLGVCYSNGQGVSKDEKEAVNWYLKAAEQGDADAQFNLAFCYKDGQWVAKNEKEALRWYQKAADQGHVGAQNILRQIQKP